MSDRHNGTAVVKTKTPIIIVAGGGIHLLARVWIGVLVLAATAVTLTRESRNAPLAE